MNPRAATRGAVLSVALVGVVAIVSPLAREPRTIPPAYEALKTWREACDRHEPGVLDAPTFEIAAWTPGQLTDVLATLLALVKDLQKAGGRRQLVESRNQPVGTQDLTSWLGLSLAEMTRGDATRVLKCGALLHTDIAILFEDRMAFAHQSPARSGSGASVWVRDGQFVGFALDAGHLDFARRLLDQVRPSPSGDADVRAWYRAVAAHLSLQTSWGGLSRHVGAGRELLPDDAVLAMMEGVLHQGLASPRVQASVATVVVPPGMKLNVASRARELAQARAAYRDALKRDPGLVEARIRMGRVLADQGRAADAARELAPALSAAEEPLMQYYAAMFLGEVEATLGREAEASQAFERARELFPHAQSPLLALSRVSRARGERGRALTPLHALTRLPVSRETGDDPWWTFQESAGRHAEAQLSDVRRRLAGETTP